MKKTILLFSFLIIFIFVHSQRFKIIGGYTTNLKPNYNRTGGQVFDTVHLHLRINGKYDSGNLDSNTVTFEIKEFNLPNNPKLVNNTMTFSESTWPGNNSSKDTTIILSLLTNTLKDTLQNDTLNHSF